MASSIAPNNLLSNAAQSKICTAFGIKITPDTSIVHIAKAAGYDSLFIDLEHTAMTIKDANQLCITQLGSRPSFACHTSAVMGSYNGSWMLEPWVSLFHIFTQSAGLPHYR